MKKRILSLVLICTMLLSIVLTVSSCGDESKVNKAMAKSRGLNHLDVDLLLDLDVEVCDREKTGAVDKNGKDEYRENWDSKSYQMTYKILEATLENGDVLAQVTGGWYGDEKYHKSTYFDNGYVYLPNKTKQAIDDYKKYNTYYPDLVRALLMDLPSEVFEGDDVGSKMVKVEDMTGVTFVSGSFDVEKNDEQSMAYEKIASPLLNLIIDRLTEYMVCSSCRDGKNSCSACGDKATDCEACASMRRACAVCEISKTEHYGKCKIEQKLENGYTTESQLEFRLELELGEDKVFIEGKMKIKINNPGQEIGVKFPYEYEKYPLVATEKRPTVMDLLK